MPVESDGSSSDGRQHLVDLADAEVAAEERRRTSLESRGLALVTVAGTLVTALTAVAAVVRTRAGYVPATVERIALVISVVAFVGAVGFGVATNAPRRASMVDPQAFLDVARASWHDAEEDVQAAVLATHVDRLRDVQRSNDLKGALLLLGMGVLGLATAGLGVATIAALLR